MFRLNFGLKPVFGFKPWFQTSVLTKDKVTQCAERWQIHWDRCEETGKGNWCLSPDGYCEDARSTILLGKWDSIPTSCWRYCPEQISEASNSPSLYRQLQCTWWCKVKWQNLEGEAVDRMFSSELVWRLCLTKKTPLMKWWCHINAAPAVSNSTCKANHILQDLGQDRSVGDAVRLWGLSGQCRKNKKWVWCQQMLSWNWYQPCQLDTTTKYLQTTSSQVQHLSQSCWSVAFITQEQRETDDCPTVSSRTRRHYHNKVVAALIVRF